MKVTNELRRQVMQCRAVGLPEREIAAGLKIDPKTLRRHFAYELRHGPEIVRKQLIAAVLASALGGDKTARRILANLDFTITSEEGS